MPAQINTEARAAAEKGLEIHFRSLDQFFTGTLRGKEPRATIDAVRMGRKKMFASSAKAERELGYRIVPVQDALRRAITWFQSHGYAPRTSEATQVSA